ncbi:hypothetical protein [Caballeronia sp. LZ001]|uniref:hypothetical protein n=1 Tax=Caballeronia sp. LZ001 TaxID=3038553 RepID=UPI0028608619|nr:hypothetical protein [Caballeronia sp. LZ001]MDR5806012.1 hypothetical protein [Caballeronia sp. LZ001]
MIAPYDKRRASDIPDTRLYAEAFDPARPLATPAGLRTDNPAIAVALAAAAVALRTNGFAFDSTRGEMLHALDDNTKIPLYGDCDPEAYFHGGVSVARP